MRCAAVQERLADEGAGLIGRDAAIREHVAGCNHCGSFLEALERVDAGLSRLPPVPAPPSLLARTAKAVNGESKPAPGHRSADPGARKLAAALAATVILAAGFGLVESVQQELERVERRYAGAFSDSFREERYRSLDESRPATMVAKAPAPRPAQTQPVMPEAEAEPAPPPMEPLAAAESELARIVTPEPALMENLAAAGRVMDSPSMPMGATTSSTRSSGDTVFVEPAAGSYSNEGRASAFQLAKEQKKSDKQSAGKAKREKNVGGIVLGADIARAVAPLPPTAPADADGDVAQLRGNRMQQAPARERADDRREPENSAWPSVTPEIPTAAPAFDHERDDAARRGLLAAPGKTAQMADAKDKLESKVQSATRSRPAQSTGPRQVARRFLAERERLTGLDFQSSSGYWANTYVPGDPAIRLLEARLQRWDRSALGASLGDARLEAAARQNWQPFDVPENAALAVYLHADKRAINGRSRLRIQVGLQASLKRSGLRPDMNVGVVLDLRRPVDDATGAKLRALVMALARARQPGDRFSITVAGHPGGMLVAPEDFRYGPIRVAMQSLFTATNGTRAPAMDLVAAVHAASQSVRQGDEPSAPLGASLVLLVSTAPFTGQRGTLERMVHENAVAGIGMSVVAVGGGADLVSIDRLALLGQGHRRVLATAEDAVKLVDRELHAASRAVARAVRLRIRLAPGVELIEVLGSKNLSDQAAQRVREAERSIDQRMARNIGIRADRGEDEEGIQIVIPSFFAGDSHALLLDVVVPGPGPVADVSVRYKDLVYRRNGVARARLTIEDGHRDPGPLERNVLKNQLAYALASSATTAGQQLAAGDRRAAIGTLTAARELLTGMRQEIPGWDNDYELRGDEALLAQYLTVLGSRFAGIGQQQRHLADSLRYLAFRRLIPTHK